MIDEKTFDAVEDRRLAAALNDAAFLKPVPPALADRIALAGRGIRLCRESVGARGVPRWLKVAAALAALASFVSFAAVVGGGLVGRVVQNAQESAGSDEPISQEGTEATDGTEATVASSADVSIIPSVPAVLSIPSTTSTQGETTMTRKKAAAAALSAAMAAAPLAAANGDGYQFIISGDPVAVATEGSSSGYSGTAALTVGTLAEGVACDSEFEARSRTTDESPARALRSDKFKGIIISFK